jgi:transitional endoplasmic reticulum ATPase
MSLDPRLNVLHLPGVQALPLDESQLVTNLFFIPLARRLGTSPGILVDTVEFGSFALAWGVSTQSFCTI